ncbi:hypothetical protein ROHU_018689 [Labeo rohita]|uniref:Uncharacterized protein n=1 Tax=Labeo rohita TaxID=84645 RepID=A0A498L9T3_LABRO|nr:hypothetical protein ROHU_034497 [Labeo rohita]RXN28960.1 hypothetical protein ROHU_018689 [Labeo rohita]
MDTPFMPAHQSTGPLPLSNPPWVNQNQGPALPFGGVVLRPRHAKQNNWGLRRTPKGPKEVNAAKLGASIVSGRSRAEEEEDAVVCLFLIDRVQELESGQPAITVVGQ